MSVTLHCKKSKVFIVPGSSADGHGVRKFLVGAGDTRQAPDWVLTTDTYKWGLVDKSILNLSPPKPIAAVEVKSTSEVEGSQEPTPQEASDTAPAGSDAVPEPSDEELEAANKSERSKSTTKLPKGTVQAATIKRG